MAIVNLKPSPLVKSGELTPEFVEAYSASLNEPQWMTARRLEALRVFRDTPAPQRTDELWRRVDLSQFKLDQVIASIPLSNNAPNPAEIEAWSASLRESNALGWVLNVDGSNAQSHLDSVPAENGVIFTDFATAI